MNIAVKRYPQFWGDFITVQIKEDDEVVFCNHAGHQTQEMIFTTPYWNGENYEMSGTEKKQVEVCNKCGMWSEDEENWNE